MYGDKIRLTEIVQVTPTTHIDSELVVNCFPFQYFILLIFEIEYLQGSLFRSDENEMVVSGHAQSIEEVLDGEVVKCFFFITVVDGFLSCCKEDWEDDGFVEGRDESEYFGEFLSEFVID